MKKIFKNQKIKITMVLVLVLTLCAGVFLNPASTSVKAVSLPYIELKKDEGSFDILEIIPAAGSGSIGYYVGGYEPCADWAQQLKTMTSSAQRENYINTMFNLLEDSGLLGPYSTYALSPVYKNESDFYNEYYTWDSARPATGLTEIKLNAPETVAVHASFSPVEGGSFRSDHKAELVPDNGTHVQNIDSFTLGNSGEDAFYYAPVFSQLLEDMRTLYLNKAMYTVDAENSTFVYIENGVIGTNEMLEGVTYYLKADGDEYVKLTAEAYLLEENQGKTMYVVDTVNSTFRYRYYGIVGVTSMEFSTVYYVVSSTGQPSESYSEAAPYAAVQNIGVPFIETAENGYFTLTLTGYTYVGTGRGDSEITLGDGEYSYEITYDTIFCECGFTNNELLKKYVFDYEEADGNFIIRVNSVVASQLTANDIAKSDMVVLTKGYNPASPAATVNGYSAANDISAESKASLFEMTQRGYPFIVDSALKGIGATNLAGLASQCIDGMTDFSVKNSVFCFKSGSVINYSTVTDAIATGKLLTEFSDSVVENRFMQVLEEIETENFYREIDGTTPLDTEVSIAKVIRNIINYKGKRADTVKDKIKVLEIQPLAVDNTLSPSTILSWIGGGAGIGLTADDITVVTMTTGEFIGKLEDINEVYDLIYIGSSTDSFNIKSDKTTDYNDNSMDGLIYSNIGDLYLSDIRMAGLLERDYLTVSTGHGGSVTGINRTPGNQSNLFRFSGNDITAAKATQLKDFIDAGYPVVVADDLISGNSVNTGCVDSSSNMYDLLNSVKSRGNFITVSETSGSYKGTVLKYLQVSKPEIELEKYPIKYENNSGTATSISGYTLEYKFKINNITDATPASTTYNVHLYIDLNADGRYSDTESLGDIEVYNAAGAQLTPVATSHTDENGEIEIFTYSLYAGESYTVKRQMPSDYVGIIPWKLEIIKNGADHIHASETGYTRISAANKQLVKILQIAMAGKSGDYINLASQLSINKNGNNNQLLGKDGKYYNGIYGKLIADLDDFDVECTTVEADDLENEPDVSSYLSNYDMLIIGFGDMYDGIGQKTAKAITEFIASQKSVLFTHDTTSQANVEFPDYKTIIEKNSGESNTYEVREDKIHKSNSAIDVEDLYEDNGYWWYRQWISVWEYLTTKITFNQTNNSSVSYVYYKDWIWLNAGTYTLSCSIDNSGGLSMYVGVDLDGTIDPKTDPSKRVIASTNVEDVTLSFTVPSGGKAVRVYFSQATPGNTGTFTIKEFKLRRITLNTGVIGFNGNLSHWGYYFNTVIRDSVGLDRYGITSNLSTRFGTVQSMLYEQNDSTDLTPEQIQAIIDSERTIAYTPNTGKLQTVAETQGYTNYALIRYGAGGWLKYANNNYSGRETSVVSQVNKGQITTYPYDINTAEFDGSIGSGNLMTVGNTHEQYYQLNMNTDDIVVWYCLSSQSRTNYAEGKIWSNWSGNNPLNPTMVWAGTDAKDKRIYFNSSGRDIPNGKYLLTCTINNTGTNKVEIGAEGNGLYAKVQAFVEPGKEEKVKLTFDVTSGYSFNVFFWAENRPSECIVSNIQITPVNNSYYNDSPNDVVNAYYIFNKGNVTYSGVGHTAGNDNYTKDNIETKYINEAKLFVNTMIAAYQSGAQKPSVSIKSSSSGAGDISIKYFVAENKSDQILDGTDTQTEVGNENRAVYYKITDTNLGTAKKITVNYYYADENGKAVDLIGEKVTELRDIKTYLASTNDEETTIKGGRLYKIYLPDEVFKGYYEVVDGENKEKTTSINLYIRVCTEIGDQKLYNVTSLELVKIGLFNLG